MRHRPALQLWLRLCPYFPFDAQVCLNGHEYLACQLRHEGIAFRKEDAALATFLKTKSDADASAVQQSLVALTEAAKDVKALAKLPHNLRRPDAMQGVPGGLKAHRRAKVIAWDSSLART